MGAETSSRLNATPPRSPRNSHSGVRLPAVLKFDSTYDYTGADPQKQSPRVVGLDRLPLARA